MSESKTMTTDEFEKLPPEEKEHFAECAECGECLIDEAWTKWCFTKTTSTGRTFSIPARKSCDAADAERLLSCNRHSAFVSNSDR